MYQDERILNQLPPIEGETIFSYLSRLGAWTGYINLTKKQYTEYIYGTMRNKKPNYYICDSLEHIAKLIQIPEIECISSSHAILMKMTVFPFYKHFISPETSNAIQKELLFDTPNLNIIAKKLKIFPLKNQIENNQVIKFCPECIKENIHLNTEHMVIGNYTCYKHKTPLHYVNVNYINQNSRYINILSLDYSNGVPCIKDNLIYYNKVALFVHALFSGEISDQLKNMRKNIKYRLFELKLDVCNHLEVEKMKKEYPLFTEIFLDNFTERTLNDLIYENRSGLVIYFIYLLCFLFNDVYHYNNYKYTKNINPRKPVLKASNGYIRNRSKDVWQIILNDRFNGEYEIVGDYENSYERVQVKHIGCGGLFPVKLENFMGICPKCGKMVNKQYMQ